MIRRELAIVCRARMTWIQAALSALLVGHGFVLAVDLFSAASRSAESSTLMRRELDPLLGIVRPTMGGLYLALSLLGPIAACRSIAIEKERRAWRSLLLATASPLRVCAAKLLASLISVLLQLVAPLVLLIAWLAVGGHLAAAETSVAVSAYAVYAVWVTAIAIAAAAWTDTLAQAAMVALTVIAASWAIDASEGFAALAWLGRALDWSVTTHLGPMDRGTFAPGAHLWMAAMTGGALALAYVGARFDLRAAVRLSGAAIAIVVATTIAAATGGVRSAVDATEDRRGSLPPAAVEALRRLDAPIELLIALDRDDARRRQMEADVLAKLRLARPDAKIEFAADDRETPIEGDRSEGYGKIVVRVGSNAKETYSASRRELVTLIFEAAGAPLPSWDQPEYPGWPLIVEGSRRTVLVALAYFLLPAIFLIAGVTLARSTRRK
jgi:hypothetical protein